MTGMVTAALFAIIRVETASKPSLAKRGVATAMSFASVSRPLDRCHLLRLLLFLTLAAARGFRTLLLSVKVKSSRFSASLLLTSRESDGDNRRQDNLRNRIGVRQRCVHLSLEIAADDSLLFDLFLTTFLSVEERTP